ncbi:MAG: TonB-dependent receptor plug domain-containing protein, partial [Tannerella sp.]|nr:TonB-dependent receptor plug domain-containing protein [Tannerella sp.]
LVINPEQFPKLKYAPVSRSLWPATPAQANTFTDFIQKAGQRAQYDEDIRVVNLEEVVVTANKIEKKDEERLKYPFNRLSNVTIYREEIEKRGVISIDQALQGIPGVQVVYDQMRIIKAIYIRGISTFEKTQFPLVLINGITLDVDVLNELNIDDVESIDVFKGASTVIFGMRGGNGVISITTQSARSHTNENIVKPNSVSVTPLGYQKPVEFYAPRYDAPESKNTGIPDYRTTIYWKPDLIVSDEGQASFEFDTADFPTTYSVVIEGLTIDGKIVRQVEKIVVRVDTPLP